MDALTKKKVLHALYQPYKWLVFVPGLVLSTMVCGLSAIFFCRFLPPKKVSMVFGPFWSRFNALMTPMRVETQGMENIDPKQSYVICSNHQSHYDIFVLYGFLGVDFKWVMKEELRSVPFLGTACDRLGHVYIDRSNREKALASINAAREKIVNGSCILFFPEGTRSRDAQLGSFKKGAFKMALDLDLPILPITINGTGAILPPKTRDLYPGSALMQVHPPVSLEGYTDENMAELMDRVRDIIASGLREPFRG